MGSYEITGPDDRNRPPFEYGGVAEPDPIDAAYGHADAVTADGGAEDDIDDDKFPEAYSDQPAEARETDDANSPEATAIGAEQAPQPFSVVEIGAGGAPMLISHYAPDIKRLYQEGGKYTAIGPNPATMVRGERDSQLFLQVHTNPEATIETEFVNAALTPEAPLPQEIEPDSADRVIISNVFTLPMVARDPAACQAIAEGTARMVRKDPAGEVVVIGFFSPEEFRAGRVTKLMASVGLEHIGSDDMSQYFPPDQRDMTFMNPACYVERYRPRQQEEQQ